MILYPLACSTPSPAFGPRVGIVGGKCVTPLAVSLGRRGCPVDCLLAPRCPAAVVWRVIAIVVDAIKAMAARRTSAHIGEEILETLHPAVADHDPASAVTVPVLIGRQSTSLSHAPPCTVFRRRITARLAMRGEFFSGLVAPKTPATDRILTAEVRPQHGRLVATITSAEPYGLAPVSVGRTSADNKPANPDSSHVHYGSHVRNLTSDDER